MNITDLLTNPSTADLAYSWINILIPTGESAYAKAIATFSGTLILVASLILAWHVIAGVINSASSGKILGERFHQIYAPLRVVLGFALLIPVGDGFSSVHYLLRNVVGVVAIQLGNAPITSYIDHLETGKPIGIPSSQGAQVVKTILEKEVCIRVYNGLQEHRWLNWSGKFQPKFGKEIKESGGFWFWSETSSQEHFKWDYGPCGSYSFPLAISAQAGKRTLFYSKRVEITETIREFVGQQFDNVKLEEYIGKHGIPEPDSQLLEQLVNLQYIFPSLNDITATIQDWNSVVGDYAGTIYAEENTGHFAGLKEKINQYGFMAAGGFERHISQVSKLTMELANQTLLVEGPSVDRDILAEVDKVIRLLQQQSIRDSSKISNSSQAIAITGEYSSIDDLQSELLSYFVVPEPLKDPAGFVTDPVGTMIQRGHYFIMSATGAGTALAVASGFATSLDNDAIGVLTFTSTEALSGALRYAISWATWAVTIMFLVGILHAYVLPMIPFIMVFMMGISWLILFLEATIACVLWAFAFIRMDGKDFIDRYQAPGLALLFNLMLRPAVGMLVFIGGLILLPTILRGLMYLWDGAWSNQQYVDGTFQSLGRGLTSPFTYLAEHILFLFLQWHLTLRLFGLVPTIADRIGSWMGVSMGRGYNDGSETQSATSGVISTSMATKSAPLTGLGQIIKKK